MQSGEQRHVSCAYMFTARMQVQIGCVACACRCIHIQIQTVHTQQPLHYHCEISRAFCIAYSQSCTTKCPDAARHEGTACMSAARHSTLLVEWESEGAHGTELLCGAASRSSRIVMWTTSSRHVPRASMVRHYYSANCLARDLEVNIKQHMQLVEAIERSLATLHTRAKRTAIVLAGATSCSLYALLSSI